MSNKKKVHEFRQALRAKIARVDRYVAQMSDEQIEFVQVVAGTAVSVVRIYNSKFSREDDIRLFMKKWLNRIAEGL